MITKIFKYETDEMVFPAHLPIEYGYYMIFLELRYHSEQNMPDMYIERVKERFKDDKNNQFLIVVKQTFNKEYWTQYYATKLMTDLCPGCNQPLPVGYYDKSLKDAEERSKKSWGFKVIDEEYVMELKENMGKFGNVDSPVVDQDNGTPYSLGSYPINLPLEIININE